jgi:hypothetical protein
VWAEVEAIENREFELSQRVETSNYGLGWNVPRMRNIGKGEINKVCGR